MRTTGSYRQGIERFVPSPSEALLLVALVLFTAKLYPGKGNSVVLGLSSVVIAIVAWLLGVALRAATNDMRWWLLLGSLIAVILPWLGLNTFQIGLMSQVCVIALTIFGLNVVTGYTGQISLGHGALVGIAAYTVAILVHHWNWPMGPAMLVAIIITTLFGFVLGVPALRLAGPYLAIATLAAAIVFPLVAGLSSVEEYTGGRQGISEKKISPPSVIGDFLKETAPSHSYKSDAAKKQFGQTSYLYYLSLGTAVIGLFTVWNLGRSRYGRAFVAVRDNEVAATSMSINVALYKVTAFGISAFYAGVSGVLFFLVISFVAPESFDVFTLGINPLAYMVIGGLASTGGAVLGAVGYVWVREIIAKVATISGDFDKLQGAMTGLLLIIVMTRLPSGVWGAVTRLNRFSWQALGVDLRTWARGRPQTFWIEVAGAAVAIIALARFVGAVWAVIGAALVIVAPADAWRSVLSVLWRPIAAVRGRSAAPDHESAHVDAL